MPNTVGKHAINGAKRTQEKARDNKVFAANAIFKEASVMFWDV